MTMTKVRNVIVDIPLTTTAGAYSSGDVVGGKQTIDVAAVDSGNLASFFIFDDDNIDADMKVYLFNKDVTSFADNEAFAPTIADLKNLIGVITIAAANYTTFAGNSFVIKQLAINETIPYASNNGTVYAYAVLDGIETYVTTTALTLRYTFIVEE